MLKLLILLQALKAKCRDKKCHGSDPYQKRIIRTCLHTSPEASLEIQRYEQFTNCSKNIDMIFSNVEVVKAKMAELKTSKDHVEEEYKDENNRYELSKVWFIKSMYYFIISVLYKKIMFLITAS